LSFLQRAEELCLRRKGQVDDLIEEEASIFCQLESPFLALMRPVNAPFS